MKKLFYLLCLCTAPLLAQVQYGTPLKDEIPEELKKYSRELQVHHFPQEVHPIQIRQKLLLEAQYGSHESSGTGRDC